MKTRDRQNVLQTEPSEFVSEKAVFDISSDQRAEEGSCAGRKARGEKFPEPLFGLKAELSEAPRMRTRF
jgi:hypothetical protein